MTLIKAYLKQVVVNSAHINAEERIKLLILLNEFEDFYGTLRGWYTDQVDLYLLPD